METKKYIRYIKFIGKYTDLKHQGYKFQKLYADNRLQWHNDGFSVWKYNASLTIYDLTNFGGAFLDLILDIRDKGLTPAISGESMVVITNREEFTVKSSEGCMVAHKQAKRDDFLRWREIGDQYEPLPYLDNTSIAYITLEDVARLVKMYDEGMIEVGKWELA